MVDGISGVPGTRYQVGLVASSKHPFLAHTALTV
jgi:hypothetical protein